MIFPQSLKNMLLLSVAVLVIVSGAAISQLVTHRYSVSLLDGAAARAENIAHKLALDAADKILIHDLVALQKLLDDQMTSDPSVAYLFVVKAETVLTHTFSGGVPVKLISANAAADAENAHLEKIISEDGQRYLDIAWPIFNKRAGTLRLGLSEAPYREQVRQLWAQMSLITLGILVIALLISHWFIHRLTRPLIHLTRAAERIDVGHLDEQVKVTGRLEVTKLAAAFNAMLVRIKDYTQRLKESNVSLERKNRELDRAQNQLRTFFSISQQVAALGRLDQICSFLVKRLSHIVECRNMGLLVFNRAARTANLAFSGKVINLAPESFDALHSAFERCKNMTFMGRNEIGRLPLPERITNAGRVAIFPVRHHDLMLGAMIVVCQDNCICVTKEMDVVSMILHQTAGAIHRANIHEEDLRDLRSRIAQSTGFSGIIGKDPQMHLIYKLIEDVAQSDATILIQGESGTGKELVARAIHRQSPRCAKPFVVLNCSAYPTALLESELFGHEKGAFTGADRRKIGRFEQSEGGTVFLDEIGEIEPQAQIKLLRVLQSKKFERLGGTQTLHVDTRILAATNKILLSEVKTGRFREDLFYRLNVIPINLPPLRQRRNDIPLLARHFLRRLTLNGRKNIKDFTSEALRILLEYPWPGNVRELENSVEHAVVLAKGTRIHVADLPSWLSRSATGMVRQNDLSLKKTEKQHVVEVLETCNGNKKVAAERLGIGRSTLYLKIKKYGIEPPSA